MSLFESVVYQYIDDYGKCRAIYFNMNDEIVCLMISPIPPLEVSIYTNEILYPETQYDTVVDFCRERDITITKQSIIHENIDNVDVEISVGIWIEHPELLEGYIPIVHRIAIDNIPQTKKFPPLTQKTHTSLREIYHTNRLISEYLKQYILYLYSWILNEKLEINQQLDEPKDESTVFKMSLLELNKNRITVDDGMTYNLSDVNRVFSLNDGVFINDGNLIVPSKDIKQKLVEFVRVVSINDSQGVINYKNRQRISHPYTSIMDFVKHNNESIFLNTESLKMWKDNKQNAFVNRMYDKLFPDIENPYFFHFYSLNPSRFTIIQNVENHENAIDNAIQVSLNWMNSGVNTGFYTVVDEDYKSKHQSYILFHEDKRYEKIKLKTDNYANILQYKNGSYAAVLLLQS